MNASTINFDIYALAYPESRENLAALALELIREIETFNALWDAITKRIELAVLSEADANYPGQ